MVLPVTHEVKVIPKGGSSSASGRRFTSMEVIKKPVNFIDVACRFMTFCTGLKCCDSPLALLRATGHSIVCIYVVVILLIYLICELMLLRQELSNDSERMK